MGRKEQRLKTARRKAGSSQTRTMDKALERFLRSLYPEVKSARGLQEKERQTRAVLLVMDRPDFRWLFDPQAGTSRNTILAELGRIEDDRLLLEMAGEICRRKPTSREAVAAIRRFRGARNEPSSRKLMIKLIKSVDAYLKRHPTTTWEQVRLAVYQAAQVVEEAIREKPDG